MAGLCFSIIFGFSFMFTKEALEVIDPFLLLALRFLLAATTLTLLKITGLVRMNFKGKKLSLVFLLALFQPVFYFIFETVGINLTTSSEAGLMISLIPVAVTILAALILNEKPGGCQLVFIILSVAGVIFIVLMKSQSAVSNNYRGMALLGGAVVMAGFYNILSRRLSFSFKPVEITYIMMWAGALVFNGIALIRHNLEWEIYLTPVRHLSVGVSVLYLGLLSSIVAFFMMNYTLSRIRAFESAVFANLVTVVSIMAGVVFRNEPFYWFQVIGAVMIIIGVWGTNYYGKLRQRSDKIPA
ncbi:MAG: DMT family transporter [Bacillota bacterium]